MAVKEESKVFLF